MAQRLVKAGMRPISNVVDVTNYVLLERNQPLHAFDLDRLAGAGIVVRTAAEGESITTLDGVARTLSGDDLLICDAERAPQAIAGIMGGGDSEVSDATTAILLESAYFTPMGIARTSKRLKLRSESSARFERGIDPEGVDRHAQRALELLTTVAGAAVAPSPVDEYPRPFERPRIRVRTSKVNGVLGTTLTDREVLAALQPLGIDVEGGGDDITAIPPTFRPDLEREIDLVEEVARRVGFDAIGRTVPKPDEQVGALSRSQRERRAVVDALVGAGLAEAVSIPLVSPDELVRAGAPVDRIVEAANPLRAEDSALRTRVLPGLLRAAAGNRAHGLPDVGLFEIGHVFLSPLERAGPHPDEPLHVAGVLTGAVRRQPIEADRDVDGYDAVDLVREIAGALELADVRIESDTPAGFDPAQSARVVVDGVEAGAVGAVAADVIEAFGLEAPVVAFELDVDRLLDASRRDRSFVVPSPYPPSSIDLAFVVDETIDAGTILRTLRDAGGDELEDVRVFDVFRSDALGAGRKSVAFALRFRAPDRTLTDEEVGRLRTTCIDAVARAHDATLRG
jgi:phenylalanyl-tRNA synthetase beta chain